MECMACGGEKKYIMGSPKPRRFGYPYLCDECEWDENTCDDCHMWAGEHFEHCNRDGHIEYPVTDYSKYFVRKKDNE